MRTVFKKWRKSENYNLVSITALKYQNHVRAIGYENS